MSQEDFAPAYPTVPAKVVVADERFVMHTYDRLPVQFVSGHGATLVDSSGKEYIDLLAGIGCASLGHANPVVGEALKEQIDKVWQVGNYYYIENRNELAERLSMLLAATTDEGGHVMGSMGTLWRTFFANSGAEANEGAIKLARRYGEKRLDGASTIITARQSFHGRTLATLAACGQDKFHESFQPLPAGFVSVPLNDIDALEEAIDNPTDGPVCAVMLECVQGEGGVWNADYDYLREVRELLDDKGPLLIVDEVQTGFFRCSSPFCFQRSGIVPDIVTMAKGIADGFPMGAVSARTFVADMLKPGDHGSTFGGNALACAAALATLREFSNQEIGEHVIRVGGLMRRRLNAMDHVTEVRGHGLMRGIQLDEPIATQMVEEGLKDGLVLNHIGDSIIRILPPLVITEEEATEACDRFEAILARIA